MDAAEALGSFLRNVRAQPQQLQRILALTDTLSLDGFVKAPHTVYNFNEGKGNRYVPLALELLKLDVRLDNVRLRCVPGRIKEEVFWRNYLSRVYEIAVSDAENARPSNDKNAFADLFSAFHVAVADMGNKAAVAEGPLDLDVLRQFRELAPTKASPLRQEMSTVVELLQRVQQLREIWLKSPHARIDGALSYALQGYLHQALSTRHPSHLMLSKFDGMKLRSPAKAAAAAGIVAFLKANVPEMSQLGSDEVMDMIGMGLYEGGDSDFHWVVNTAPTTLGASSGCVSLALVNAKEDRVVVAGVLAIAYGPAKAHLYCCAEAGGTWLRTLGDNDTWSQPEQLHVGGSQVFAATEQFCKLSGAIRTLETLQLAQTQLADLLADSVAAGYLGVLHNNAAAFVVQRNPTEPMAALEHAAPALMLGEAGATMTDLDGKPLTFRSGRLLRNNQGIIACNTRLSERLRTAIEKVCRPTPVAVSVKIRRHFVDPRAIKRVIVDSLGTAADDVEVDIVMA